MLDDGSFKYVYGVGRIAEVSGSGTWYYLPDGLGSTMALVDASGSVVNTYDYAVFGAIRQSTGSQPNRRPAPPVVLGCCRPRLSRHAVRKARMKLGVSFSHPEIGNDPAVIRDFVQAVEGAGYDHLLAAEHVIGGHPDRQREGERVHTYETPYHDPFVLFAFIGGLTRRLELVSSILILPQRPTVLVAKQAADLDLLTGGRLRLGVGLGRNWMEYQVLNQDFHNRGRRIEEQVQVLRRLWTEELVTFKGRWHHIDRMGLNPMPVQRPIPIWMGSYTQVVERAIKRIAHIADGWLPQFPPDDAFRALLERFRGYAREAGRDPASIGLECGVRVAADDDPESWLAPAQAFQEMGATHLRVTTAGRFASMQQRIDVLARARQVLAGV